MNNLKIIENELVPVYETSTGEKVVYGTELHAALQAKSKFTDWVKNRLSDCEAQQNKDYEAFSKNLENGGRLIEYVIRLDTAKEMAMLERNEIGKQTRRYFIQIEDKYNDAKDILIQYQDMFPQVQFMIKMEAEQKRQAREIDNVKETQKTISQALGKAIEEDFRSWIHRSLSAIAESENYQYMGSQQERHQAIRVESYERLTAKRPCRLEQRVAHERGRAIEAGASQSRVKAINKLTIIEGDKGLKSVYESVIREMLVAYCVTIK